MMKKIFATLLLCLTITTAMAQGKTLYGFTRDYPYAMLSIDTSDPTAAKRVGKTEMLVSAGAIVKDVMYVTAMDDDFNTLVYSVNLENGAMTKLKNLGEDAALPVEMSYDYADEQMYFVSNSVNAEGMSALWTINLQTLKMTKVQDNMGEAIRAIAINAQGDMYGLSRAGKLYTVDKEKGKIGKVIGSTGHSPYLFTTMDFDRATGRLYWACYENSTHKLYEINTATAAVTDLGFIGSGNGLYTVALDMPYEPSAATAPARIDSLKVIPNEKGQLSATITWQNPTLMANEEALKSLTKVEVMRGEEVIATLTEAMPGAVMSYEDTTVPANGEYRYTVRAYNEIGASADRFVDAYVGHDLLAAPERVIAALGAQMGLPVLTNIIAWDTADKGIHGGYVDTENVVYDVIRVNDNVIIAQGTNLEACLDEHLADTLTRYIYKVVPRNADGNGQGKESNYLVNGPAAKVPFIANFDQEKDAELWTVLDVNQDGYAFLWWRPNWLEGKGVYLYQTHEYNYALDMIVTPPVEFQEGHNYKITVSCCNSFAPYPESFMLYSLAGYTTQGAVPIGEPVNNINHPNEFRDYSVEFNAEDDGVGASDELFTSFVGVCCTSNPAMQMFMVSKVTIEDMTPAGISSVVTLTPADNRVYDLQGRRISGSQARKGLYIINGKKYIK
ncbi:MAG: hypothetical protein IKQ05_00180 [Prevotella sp.]|nr:hypothetical protein [Prevotella sp.]